MLLVSKTRTLLCGLDEVGQMLLEVGQMLLEVGQLLYGSHQGAWQVGTRVDLQLESVETL